MRSYVLFKTLVLDLVILIRSGVIETGYGAGAGRLGDLSRLVLLCGPKASNNGGLHVAESGYIRFVQFARYYFLFYLTLAHP